VSLGNDCLQFDVCKVKFHICKMNFLFAQYSQIFEWKFTHPGDHKFMYLTDQKSGALTISAYIISSVSSGYNLIMKKQKMGEFAEVSFAKKVVVTVSFFSIFFAGMFAAVASFGRHKNYAQPVFFSAVCIIIGLAVGYIIARLLKAHIMLNKTMEQNYGNLVCMFSLGVAGLFLLLGQSLNTAIARKIACDAFRVNRMFHTKSGYRRPVVNKMIVDIDGNPTILYCSYRFYNSVSNNQLVNVCIYKSPIGFDFFELTDDK